MGTKAVVTDVGTITPIGNDVESFWWRLKGKTVGTGLITYLDTIEYKCKLAARVEGFDPKQYMDTKAARRMKAFSQFTMVAPKEALEQSGIDMEKENPYRVDVCVGSGIDSFQTIEKDVEKLSDKGPSRVDPLLVPLMTSNIAASNVAIQFGSKGKCLNVVTACATGAHSIGEAFRPIQYGEADVVVAGGAEASTTPVGIARFTSLTVLNTTEGISGASIPFDEDRNGFVMGEGAGMVVLESLERAKARGASILAEAVRYGATCGTFHITSPAEDGSGTARAMENTMKDADITAGDISYANAHDTSTHHNDLSETKAIKLALGDHAQGMKINSTKSMTGHPPGTAGDVEFITYVKSIQDGFVHVTAGLKEPGEGCDLGYTMGNGVSINVDVAISDSLGFGGHNASLIVKKFGE